MPQGVEQVVAHPWEERVAGLGSLGQSSTACLDGDGRLPGTDRLLIQLEEDPLASDLGRRQPVRAQAERRGLHSQIVLPLKVRTLWFEPGESDLNANLAQL